MAVVYFRKEGKSLIMCDKEMIRSRGKFVTVGAPKFMLEAKSMLTNEPGDDIEAMLGNMQEGRSYKMVLREWPIE